MIEASRSEAPGRLSANLAVARLYGLVSYKEDKEGRNRACIVGCYYWPCFGWMCLLLPEAAHDTNSELRPPTYRLHQLQQGSGSTRGYAARRSGFLGLFRSGMCVREDLALAVAVQDWAISSNVEEYTMRLTREKVLENNAASIVALQTRAAQQSTTSLPAPSPGLSGKYY